MSTTLDNSNLAHRQTWNLIPWVVNGSATPAERQIAETHLAECVDCRDELAFQSLLHAGMAMDARALNDGGLAAIANSIAELLNAPVTIEDPDTIVMAYSGGEQAVDEARIGTILSRQVPLKFRTALTAAGVFDRLHTTDEVIYVDLPSASMTPRAVIAVRQNGILLGSIWAAVQRVPTPDQEAVLHYAAPIVGRLIDRRLLDRRLIDCSPSGRLGGVSP